VFNVGPAEILVVLLIALIVFGPKRLPEIGKTVGKGLREFRQATQDVKDELSRTMDDDDDEGERNVTKPVKVDGPPPSTNGETGTAGGSPVSGEAVSGT
jgi:sec-independent protein translocase protein TatA